MASMYRDPVAYLNQEVVRRGKSGPDGVYLHNVTVMVDANSSQDIRVSYGNMITPVVPPPGCPHDEWSQLLVSLRWDVRSLSKSVYFYDDSYIFQFLPEGNSLGMSIFLPEIDILQFPHVLKIARDTLICAADFCSKVVGQTRFNIGVVTKSWGDMVEEGDAEEMDLNF